MSFGYIGDTSTSVNQKVKNKGILSIQENFDLERQGFSRDNSKVNKSINLWSFMWKPTG